MFRILSADWLKIRGKGLWFLVFLGPLGLVAMQGLNFGLRYDYLTQHYSADLWGGLLNNIAAFVPVALYLGGTLLCSMWAGIEHQEGGWKQLLALPVSRTTVFMAKLILILVLIFISCLLLSAGSMILGLLLGCKIELTPYKDILRIGLLSYAATLPVLMLQLWLSLSFRNQTLPVSIGLILSVCSMFTMFSSEWVPLTWPYLAWSSGYSALFSGAGLLLGMLLLLPGALHFARKDVSA